MLKIQKRCSPNRGNQMYFCHLSNNNIIFLLFFLFEHPLNKIGKHISFKGLAGLYCLYKQYIIAFSIIIQMLDCMHLVYTATHLIYNIIVLQVRFRVFIYKKIHFVRRYRRKIRRNPILNFVDESPKFIRRRISVERFQILSQ